MKRTLYFIKFFFLSLFIFFISVGLLSFLWLLQGIKVQSFSHQGFQAEQLYLKYDNKLQLRVQNLTLSTAAQQSAASQTINNKTVIQALEWLPVLFSSIEINNLHIKNHRFSTQASVQYANNRFFIDSKQFFLYSQIQTQKDMQIEANPLLYIKDYDLFIDTRLHYDLLKNKARGTSSFTWHDAKGSLDFRRDGDMIALQARSQEFTQLKPVFDSFHLHQKINAWTYKKITAASYRLESLNFTQDLSKKLNLYNLKARAVGKNVTIDFNDDARPVKADKVDVTFEKGRLSFALDKPVFADKSIKGSNAVISDLLDGKSDYIDIHIRTKRRYDAAIKEILDAYGIDILIKQQKGTVDADLDIRVGFKGGNVDAKGLFTSSDARFSLFGYGLATKQANVRLEDGKIILDRVHIKDKNQEFSVSGTIDAKKKKGLLRTKVKHYDQFFFFAEDESFETSIDFTTIPVALSVKELGVYVKAGQNLQIDFNDLNKTASFLHYPYKNLIQIQNGRLQLVSNDYETFAFNAQAAIQQPFLFKKQPLRQFDVNGTVKNEAKQITFDINNDIHYDHKKQLLKLSDTDFNATALLQESKDDPLQNHERFLKIEGKNSNITINDHKLVSDSYTATINNEEFLLINRHQKSAIRLRITPKYLHFSGNELKDSTLHPLLNNTSLQEGMYEFNIEGPVESLEGYITIQGGTLTDMKAYNNLIALINTLPALTMFTNPGFNQEGLSIKEGRIDFSTSGSLIHIDKLDIKGKSADLEGAGIINIDNNTINMNIKIKTIKELGNLLSHVPLAGYIIFGDDKSLTFKAKIEGNLTDPQVSTNAGSKVITTPLGIIKRTIESPFKLIYDLFD